MLFIWRYRGNKNTEFWWEIDDYISIVFMLGIREVVCVRFMWGFRVLLGRS